jgi:hypothetical protein
VKRAMLARIAIGIFILAAATNGASAAIWAWGCQGKLGHQLVIFNRDKMFLVDGKPVRGNLRKAITDKITALSDAKTTSFEPNNLNSGFEDKTIEFTRNDAESKKIVITEQSSRQTSHRTRMICGRDETIDTFRKIYRYQNGKDDPKTITMQCFEYTLSTRGGRKGCD